MKHLPCFQKFRMHHHTHLCSLRCFILLLFCIVEGMFHNNQAGRFSYQRKTSPRLIRFGTQLKVKLLSFFFSLLQSDAFFTRPINCCPSRSIHFASLYLFVTCRAKKIRSRRYHCTTERNLLWKSEVDGELIIASL